MSRFCAIFKRFSNIPAIADSRSQRPVLYAGHIEQERFVSFFARHDSAVFGFNYKILRRHADAEGSIFKNSGIGIMDFAKADGKILGCAMVQNTHVGNVIGFTKNMEEMGLIVFLIKGVTYVRNNLPIKCEESFYRTNKYELVFEAIIQ
jgi:hypothetical protein